MSSGKSIVIAGGTGFLGRALGRALTDSGNQVTVLTRNAPPQTPGLRTQVWTPGATTGPWATLVDGADAVINLAGEPIAAKRWTVAQKIRIRQSRIDATTSLVDAMRAAARPPRVFISASGVGYYGSRGDEILTERASGGNDFLASVCQEWELAASRVTSVGTRLVCVRTGLVLERDGGALPKMLTPFKLGVGGPVGSGRQYWPWIHRDDWIRLVQWSLDQEQASGPLNASAPNPVTNAEFSRALGRVLRRPAFMPAPAFVLELLLGEMAGSLLLSGQRAIPAKAQELGFVFRHERVDAALASIFR